MRPLASRRRSKGRVMSPRSIAGSDAASVVGLKSGERGEGVEVVANDQARSQRMTGPDQCRESVREAAGGRRIPCMSCLHAPPDVALPCLLGVADGADHGCWRSERTCRFPVTCDRGGKRV